MKNIDQYGLLELSHEEALLVSGGKDGDALYYVTYGLGWLGGIIKKAVVSSAECVSQMPVSNFG